MQVAKGAVLSSQGAGLDKVIIDVFGRWDSSGSVSMPMFRPIRIRSGGILNLNGTLGGQFGLYEQDGQLIKPGASNARLASNFARFSGPVRVEGGSLEVGRFDDAGTVYVDQADFEVLPGAALRFVAQSSLFPSRQLEHLPSAHPQVLRFRGGGSVSISYYQFRANPLPGGNPAPALTLIADPGMLTLVDCLLALDTHSLFLADADIVNGISINALSLGARWRVFGDQMSAGTLTFRPGASVLLQEATLSMGRVRGPFALSSQGESRMLLPYTREEAQGSWTILGGRLVLEPRSIGQTFTVSESVDLRAGSILAISLDQLEFGPQSTLRGSGTVRTLPAQPIAYACAIAPHGLLSIEGDVKFTETSRLRSRVRGSAASLDFDRLQISGLAILKGAVHVQFANGYTPRAGDVWPLIEAAGLIEGQAPTLIIEDQMPGFDARLRLAGNVLELVVLNDGVPGPLWTDGFE